MAVIRDHEPLFVEGCCGQPFLTGAKEPTQWIDGKQGIVIVWDEMKERLSWKSRFRFLR